MGTSRIVDVADLHGFLWENEGPIIDLNKVVLPGSALNVISAVFINDGGEIAARGLLPNGDIHAILLIPCDDNHPEIEGCDYDPVEATTEASDQSAQNAQAPADSPAKLSPTETMAKLRSRNARQHPGFSSARPQ